MENCQLWCGCISNDSNTLLHKVKKYLSNKQCDICEDIKSSNYCVLFIDDPVDCLDKIKALIKSNRNVPFLVILSRDSSTSENYWKLMQIGCTDILESDSDIEAAINSRIQRWLTISSILESTLVQSNLIGKSEAWLGCLRNAIESACFSSSPVLILGESGTGKEMIARLIHSIDEVRKHKNLVILDCSTIMSDLSGSEFFGHEKGAFTGAHNVRDGAFALAHNGSLFLDEIGELPMHLQSQLLRIIQEKTYKRVGGNVWSDTDFRLISATNRDLLTEVNNGTFRQDLYYRIACKIIKLPTLDERVNDILDLAKHFLSEFIKKVPPISAPVAQYLQTRCYRGNIRELRQLMARISMRYTGAGPITIGHIPEEDRPAIEDIENPLFVRERMKNCIQKYIVMGKGLKLIGKMAEDLAIELAIKKCEGNTAQAAKMLQVSDRTLQLRKADVSRAASRSL